MILLLALSTAGCETTVVGTELRTEQPTIVQWEAGLNDAEIDSTSSGIQLENQVVVNGNFTQVSVSCQGPGTYACPAGVGGQHFVLVTLKNTSTSSVKNIGVSMRPLSNCQLMDTYSSAPATVAPDEIFSVLITVNVFDGDKKFGVWFDLVGEVL